MTSGVKVILNWAPLVVEAVNGWPVEEGCLNIARLPLQNRLADAWCGTGLDEPAFPYARSQKREIVLAVTVRIAD